PKRCRRLLDPGSAGWGRWRCHRTRRPDALIFHARSQLRPLGCLSLPRSPPLTLKTKPSGRKAVTCDLETSVRSALDADDGRHHKDGYAQWEADHAPQPGHITGPGRTGG